MLFSCCVHLYLVGFCFSPFFFAVFSLMGLFRCGSGAFAMCSRSQGALFTFGLSVPIGAAIGGGAGWAVGTVVGLGAGAVGGGVAASGIYSRLRVDAKCLSREFYGNLPFGMRITEPLAPLLPGEKDDGSSSRRLFSTGAHLTPPWDLVLMSQL